MTESLALFYCHATYKIWGKKWCHTGKLEAMLAVNEIFREQYVSKSKNPGTTVHDRPCKDIAHCKAFVTWENKLYGELSAH